VGTIGSKQVKNSCIHFKINTDESILLFCKKNHLPLTAE